MVDALPALRSTPSTSNGQTMEDEDIVRDASGSVVSGGAESLISLLLPSSSTSSSSEDASTYAFTLLLNIRTTMAPIDVLISLFHQTMYSQNSRGGNFCREKRSELFHTMYSLASMWSTHIPHDFTNQEMIRRLEELLQLVCIDEEHRVKSNQLILTLKSTLSRIDRYEKALATLVVKQEEELASSQSIIGLFSISSDTSLISQQLTHIELERLSMMALDDIVLAISESSHDSLLASPSHPSVNSCIHWFNRLSSLVATEILRHSRKRLRASIIDSWIETAKECFDRGNFNSTCAIVAGLNSTPIQRLKRTWSKVDRAKLDILQHQLDPSGNFVSYRSTMKAALWRAEGASKDDEKVIIPFFGLLLKDLFMIYHNNPRELPNGHLNFKAFSLLSSSLYPLAEWKRRTVSFPRHPIILQYLLVAMTYEEDALLLRSFEYEEPDTPTEKEMHKKMKKAS
ncbi:hypothetical protein PFISCL1PPCAC_16305 [Pristionchus fissidentatus]|uniref:Ras-GEF domain-containing protein n=1 Tax=Pristionchus fissidentatus TaxID=1538716 RepID=A0AAV5W037_9BILA|nr:hypothetical protein PFISCL1PPCAC_16305 [Pristionchus fissidentatus]